MIWKYFVIPNIEENTHLKEISVSLNFLQLNSHFTI